MLSSGMLIFTILGIVSSIFAIILTYVKVKKYLKEEKLLDVRYQKEKIMLDILKNDKLMGKESSDSIMNAKLDKYYMWLKWILNILIVICTFAVISNVFLYQNLTTFWLTLHCLNIFTVLVATYYRIGLKRKFENYKIELNFSRRIVSAFNNVQKITLILSDRISSLENENKE